MTTDGSGRRGFLKAGIAATVAAGTTVVGELAARAAPPGTPEKEGTLLRGADGKLYFVPDDALAPFAVEDGKRTRLEAKFGEGIKGGAVNLPGKDVAESGIAAYKAKNVLLVNVGALRVGAMSVATVAPGAFKATPAPPGGAGAYKVTPAPPTKK